MLPQFNERFVAQLTILLEGTAIRSAHESDEVASEFEWSTFESSISSGRGEKVEAKVDVDNMAFVVQEDVAVVSVFDLHEETNDGVCLCNIFTRDSSVESCETFAFTTEQEKKLQST